MGEQQPTDRPAAGTPAGADVPRPPAYAWAWLQRSRPVVAEAARRLLGGPGPQGFVDDLRAAFDDDPFVRSVLTDVVATVAFSGRVPQRRPAGVSWDRGLTWWAAALAGTTPAEYEARSCPEFTQRQLFPPEPAAARPSSRPRAGSRRPAASASRERAALAAALRELLAVADGDDVPASAVRQLLSQLEAGRRP